MKAWKITFFFLALALLVGIFPPPFDLQPVLADSKAEEHLLFLPLVTFQRPTIIPESTNILTDQSNQFLVSISADSSEFVFSQTTAELDEVEAGEIIVSGISVNTPQGYLRTVLTKQVSSGQVVFTTGPASLEDAIQQTSLKYSYSFTPNDIEQVTTIAGVTPSNLGPESPKLNLVDLELEQVVINGLTAGGHLSLDVDLDFDFEVGFFSLERMKLVLSATEMASVELGSSYETSVAEEVKIATYHLQPMTISAGGFPIVVKPTIDIVLGLNGTASASLSTSVTQMATLAGGVQYEDGNLSPISEFDKSFSYQEPSLSAEMDFEAYVGGELELDFYSPSPLKPELELIARVGPRLQADQSLCWVLKGFLQVDLMGELKFLKWELEDFGTNLADLEMIIMQARTCTPINYLDYRLETGVVAWAANVYDDDDYQVDSEFVSGFGNANEIVVSMSAADAVSGSCEAHGTSIASVVYQTTTNPFGISSITGSSVMFDIEGNFNPNQVFWSSASIRALGIYYVEIANEVAGDFVINLSSEVLYSSDDIIDGGVFHYNGQVYEIPVNGSLELTINVEANNYSYLQLNAFEIFGSHNYDDEEYPLSGSGRARTTFEWTFYPGGAP